MKRVVAYAPVVSLVALTLAAACGSSGGGAEAPDSGGAGGEGGASTSDSGSSSGGKSSGDGGSSSGSKGSSSSGSSSGGKGSSSSGSGSGGSSGSSSGGGSGSSSGAASGDSVKVHVTNGCPIDIWVHAVGKEATLTPDNVRLTTGTSQDYDAPLTWSSARVYAYLEGPDGSGNPQGQNDKIETSFYVTNGQEYINSDITYVDWVALPSQIQVLGTGSDCTTAACDLPYAQILSGCPSTLLSGKECLSAGSFCLNGANANDPYCHTLDALVTQCASEYSDCAAASGSKTAQVFSCSGSFFGGSPQYCAALNRGILATPSGTTAAGNFYKTPPFNTYSEWVHQQCPGIYAFPYDDYGPGGQSSDHTCIGATQMNVTFCPKG